MLISDFAFVSWMFCSFVRVLSRFLEGVIVVCCLIGKFSINMSLLPTQLVCFQGVLAGVQTVIM